MEADDIEGAAKIKKMIIIIAGQRKYDVSPVLFCTAAVLSYCVSFAHVATCQQWN